MAKDEPDLAFRRVSELELDSVIVDALRGVLPAVAEQTVAAVTAEVPNYAGAFSGRMGETIQSAVQWALGTFLRWVDQSAASDLDTPIGPALEGAYELGRGEARGGRSMDALQAAYRVGARVAWRELSATAVTHGLPATTVAKFAELVFAFIDELSAASVSGHADELATSGRVRQRYLERLGQHIIAAESEEALRASAERAGWQPPTTLTAVLVPAARARSVVTQLSPRTLQLVEDLPGIDADDGMSLLLVPDMDGPSRPALLGAVDGTRAVVGPAREWTKASSSYSRALRGRALASDDVVDTDTRLAELVLGADLEALHDLRRQVLAPLSTLSPNTAERLAETLRSWLLHQGRRNDVAEELFVHAQTVRYRMGQLRELYGDRLEDPRTVLELTVALATNPDNEVRAATDA
ncbi:PucR family transcriptional regulator [Antrihabitans cavernicola]|uniref:PucR family transcriptional regulator n=1 Tax=Antrihabitans cavernicola TaxID=2495913 RepID=A0A5A7S988_9NOCA|nr:helix-turn-helix domain-containing protein [Spelaeibacter cavernicola]KAA0019498.1 PucR family transcriptional regulator [Spelaeibacter cavernicola]